MQSSTAIAIRALLMLIVLISVPSFAIFGKNLPDVVKGLLEGRGLVLGPAPEATVNSPTTVPLPATNNPFGQPASYRAAADAGPSTPAVATSANPAMLNTGPPGSPVPASNMLSSGNIGPVDAGLANAKVLGAPAADRLMLPQSSAAVAPGVNFGLGTTPPTNAGPNAMPQSAMTGSVQPNDWHIPTPTSTAQPASFQSPPEAIAMTPSDLASRDSLTAGSQTESPYIPKIASAGGATANRTANTSDEKFRQAETRLRELGATHYMLETWGPDNNRYHFVCKMAIGDNADVSRVFQAFGDDPWQAMGTVLRQVEEWRARPQPQ